MKRNYSCQQDLAARGQGEHVEKAQSHPPSYQYNDERKYQSDTADGVLEEDIQLFVANEHYSEAENIGDAPNSTNLHHRPLINRKRFASKRSGKSTCFDYLIKFVNYIFLHFDLIAFCSFLSCSSPAFALFRE